MTAVGTGAKALRQSRVYCVLETQAFPYRFGKHTLKHWEKYVLFLLLSNHFHWAERGALSLILRSPRLGSGDQAGSSVEPSWLSSHNSPLLK